MSEEGHTTIRLFLWLGFILAWLVLWDSVEAKEYVTQYTVSEKTQVCVDKHVRRINKLNPDSSVKLELAKWLCVHLKPVERDYAIAIAAQESGIEQINSRSEKDIGIFQISVKEIKNRKLSKQLLEENVEYEVLVFRDILRDKLKMCTNRYPFTAIACFHSATPKFHYRYMQRIEKYFSLIRRLK
jgi:hypothetical protein